MAEEDLLFGKNRHFFGGLEPSNMLTFAASSSYDMANNRPRIKIIANLPNDTIVDGQLLCTVAGAVIRKSRNGYPETEFDGEEFAIIAEDSVLYDTDIVAGEVYYYSAFPYTTQGVYCRNKANRASGKGMMYSYLFGYDLDTSDSNPATRVTYPSDVDNAAYAAAKMNFSTGVFNYGNWPSTPGEAFMPRPCMLTYAGVVDQYLNPNDYTKKVDGTASDVANTSFGGNAMMEWPKIYTKRELVGSVYKFRCCDIPLGDDWECWTNYDKNNKEIPHFYTPIYYGSLVSNRLRSISGQANLVSKTASDEITYAKANGADSWYIEVLADRLLICDLLTMMAKSTDHQVSYGYGRCKEGNTEAIGQGTMNTKGLFWGEDDQTSGVKVFGMENWWGNLWRRTAGYINANGTQKVKITRGTKDGSVATDYNTDGANYLTISGATPSGTSGGYINTMKTMPYGRLPVTANGSGTTYEADGLWFNNSQNNYALFGGSWANALLCGGFCVSLNYAASNSHARIGAALSCKPLA